MNIPLPTTSSLPDWMILFAFFASMGLTILVIIEALSRTLRKASLNFILTREIFVRLLESGECIYANGVLIAYDSGALVQDIEATLEKSNGSIKKFNLDILSVGEKFRSNEGFALHYFPSTSPLAFIPKNQPQRVVYLCSQESYAQSIKKCFNEFSIKLYEIKNQFIQYTATNLEELEPVATEIKNLVNDICSKIMDNVQIELGKYKLTICLKYRQQGKILPFFRQKTAISSVEFTVENNVRDSLRLQLENLLHTQVANFLTNQPPPVIYPEYTPLNIKEVA